MDNENKGLYKDLAGSYVRVSGGNNASYTGYMVHTDCERTLLKPSIIDESVGDRVIKARIEYEKPMIIRTDVIQAVAPITKEHLDDILSYVETKAKEQQAKDLKDKNNINKKGIFGRINGFFSALSRI